MTIKRVETLVHRVQLHGTKFLGEIATYLANQYKDKIELCERKRKSYAIPAGTSVTEQDRIMTLKAFAKHFSPSVMSRKNDHPLKLAAWAEVEKEI